MARKVVKVMVRRLVPVAIMAPPASGSGHSFSSVSVPSDVFIRSMWALDLDVREGFLNETHLTVGHLRESHFAIEESSPSKSRWICASFIAVT